MARFHRVFVVCNGTTPYMETVALSARESSNLYTESHDEEALRKGDLVIREADLVLKEPVEVPHA